MLGRRAFSQNTLLLKNDNYHLSEATATQSPLFIINHLYCKKRILSLPQPLPGHFLVLLQVSVGLNAGLTWGSCSFEGQPSNPMDLPPGWFHKAFLSHNKRGVTTSGRCQPSSKPQRWVTMTWPWHKERTPQHTLKHLLAKFLSSSPPFSPLHLSPPVHSFLFFTHLSLLPSTTCSFLCPRLPWPSLPSHSHYFLYHTSTIF